MVLMAGILRWFKLEWWMASGRVDYKRGRYQAALQSFQQLVALYPQHLLAQSYVGACYMSLKQYDDGVLAFERGLQIKSDSAYCHAELGRASMYLSRDRDAIEYLNRALRISPKYEQRARMCSRWRPPMLGWATTNAPVNTMPMRCGSYPRRYWHE